jgi:hypothetical protein
MVFSLGLSDFPLALEAPAQSFRGQARSYKGNVHL